MTPASDGELLRHLQARTSSSLSCNVGPTQSDRSLHRSGNPPSHRPLAQEPILDFEETRGMPNSVRNDATFSAWVTERIERWSMVEQEPHGRFQPFPVGGEPWRGAESTSMGFTGTSAPSRATCTWIHPPAPSWTREPARLKPSDHPSSSELDISDPANREEPISISIRSVAPCALVPPRPVATRWP